MPAHDFIDIFGDESPIPAAPFGVGFEQALDDFVGVFFLGKNGVERFGDGLGKGAVELDFHGGKEKSLFAFLLISPRLVNHCA